MRGGIIIIINNNIIYNHNDYSPVPRFVSSECRTVLEAFRHGAAISSGGLCLGWRASPSLPYQWATYEEVIRRAKNFGSGERGIIQIDIQQNPIVMF